MASGDAKRRRHGTAHDERQAPTPSTMTDDDGQRPTTRWRVEGRCMAPPRVSGSTRALGPPQAIGKPRRQNGVAASHGGIDRCYTDLAPKLRRSQGESDRIVGKVGRDLPPLELALVQLARLPGRVGRSCARHLWTNPAIQQTMQRAGFMDEAGRPVDVRRAGPASRARQSLGGGRGVAMPVDLERPTMAERTSTENGERRQWSRCGREEASWPLEHSLHRAFKPDIELTCGSL